MSVAVVLVNFKRSSQCWEGGWVLSEGNLAGDEIQRGPIAHSWLLVPTSLSLAGPFSREVAGGRDVFPLLLRAMEPGSSPFSFLPGLT